jgi:branched-chain amino acid aminotransferase
MSTATWAEGTWSPSALTPVAPVPLHPAAHALHYGSSCFEGMKAHRGDDGIVRLFRMDDHVARFEQSTRALALPSPPRELLATMITDVVRDGLGDVPAPPGSLYVRPTIIGTEPNIGAAAHATAEALLFVLASPVGDYFTGGIRPLALAIETDQPRTTPQFGMVKTGANYAMALRLTLDAQQALGVDQVLFAPGGDVQETGASNILLIDGTRLVTPTRTSAFLHGVTLDSVLRLAPELGYSVEERPVTAEEVVEWAERPTGEIALSGTAAVMAGIGEIVHAGGRTTVGSGEVGAQTLRLREALTELQRGGRPDEHGWLTAVQA